jgi:hypothetical protein
MLKGENKYGLSKPNASGVFSFDQIAALACVAA